jgi:hypothetical protein
MCALTTFQWNSSNTQLTIHIHLYLLTKKLMSQGFQMSRLQAAFRKFYGRYNDLIYPYNLSLGHMLSDMFHNTK